MADRKTFYGIQVLRGFAAFLVLAFHVALGLRDGYGLEPPSGVSFSHLPVPFLGNGGVDLFFLISGFVIVWTTQDSWRRDHAWRGFLEKRAVRIFPLYWGLTAGKIILVLVMPFLFKDAVLLPWNTVLSFALIPSFDAKGDIQPVISAGWTLCYEMFFYYFCAICLAQKLRPVMAITPIFVVLGIVGMFRTPAWGALASWIDPLLLEFVGGMWIAELTRRGLVRGSVLPMLTLMAAGLAGLLCSDLLPIPTEYGYRVLVWGVPAAAILYSTIALESRFDFRKLWLLLIIGDASYSIYLSHVLVLQPIVSRAKALHLPAIGEWGVFFVIVAIGLAFGTAVWWLVERKLIGSLLTFSKPMREAWVNPRQRAAVRS